MTFIVSNETAQRYMSDFLVRRQNGSVGFNVLGILDKFFDYPPRQLVDTWSANGAGIYTSHFDHRSFRAYDAQMAAAQMIKNLTQSGHSSRSLNGLPLYICQAKNLPKDDPAFFVIAGKLNHPPKNLISAVWQD